MKTEEPMGIPQTTTRQEQAALLRRVRKVRNAMRRAGKTLCTRSLPRVVQRPQ